MFRFPSPDRPIFLEKWKASTLIYKHTILFYEEQMVCNLEQFELSDGKKPGKFNSFIPRKWLKHCYLQGFVNVTIFEFLKNA